MSDSLPSTPDSNTNEPKPPKIVMLPTGDLYVPDWNPRKYIDEGEMQKLVAYRKNGGQVPPIWVWKGAGQAPWAIISGQRRWIADARLGKTHIAAIILDITLEEAMILAYASNTDSKPHWLESVTTIERLYKAQTKKSQDKLGAALGGVSGARINLALKLAKGLNPSSRALIVNRVNDLGSESAGSEKAVRALTDILTPEEVEKALPVFLERKMTETQAKGLANHVKAGKPPETYGKPNPAPQAPQAVTAPTTAPTQPEKEETLAEILAGMKTDWGLLPNASGTEKESRENKIITIFSAAIGAGLIWLAWKAVVWAVTTVIHWL